VDEDAGEGSAHFHSAAGRRLSLAYAPRLLANGEALTPHLLLRIVDHLAGMFPDQSGSLAGVRQLACCAATWPGKQPSVRWGEATGRHLQPGTRSLIDRNKKPTVFPWSVAIGLFSNRTPGHSPGDHLIRSEFPLF